jgi:Coenzyme PQQ synthesis protein D (PqqD)
MNRPAASILDRRAELPEHVVWRAFDKQTVLLNLQSGNYHGLNQVAMRMLEASTQAPTPREVVADLAAEFKQPESVIENDLAELLQGLADRGLVVADAGDGD